MAYGTIKVDTIIFTNGGSDQSISVSGVVQSISGDITATGTIQGATIIGTSTVSGATVTGDAGQFTTATITSGITSSGVIQLSNGSFSSSAGYGLALDSSGTSGVLVRANSSVGVQLINGATAWTPFTSESRLKNIVGDVDKNQAWDLVRSIELKRYYYKDQDDQTGIPYMGPMADWLEQQDPELVIYNEPNEEGPVRTYNQAVLDMKSLAALQLALERIETLEAEVAALKAS